MFKKILGFVLLTVLAFSCVAYGQDTLNIISWHFYVSPTVVSQFESINNVKIQVTEISTYDEMRKLVYAEPDRFDIIITGDQAIPGLINDEMIQPLNKNLIKNFKNIDPMFMNFSYDPNNVYSVPYHLSYFGIAYNKNNVSPEEATLRNFFEPSEKFKGRLVTLPNSRIIIGMAMKYMGYSFNNRDTENLELAEMLLQNVAANSTPESGDLSRDILEPIATINEGKADLAIYYIMEPLFKSLKLADNVGFAIPEEGIFVGMDTMTITKQSKNVEMAHKFIDYILDPVNAATSVRELGSGIPVLGVKEQLDSNLANTLYLSIDVLKKSDFMDPLTPDQEKVYNDIWEEVF